MDNDLIQLNLLGVTEGTDKTFLGNNYLTQYARIFEPFRHADINVLEIGVASGGSLRTWRKYFSRATIIGIDILPKSRDHAGDRMIVEIGSQTDEAFLSEIADKYKPTIIIDDGSHESDHQIISLECLFQRLPQGGIYVVEDLFFQANPATSAKFGARGPLAIDLLCKLGRDISSWRTEDPAMTRFRKMVGYYLARIEFLPGMVVLYRDTPSISPTTVLDLALKAVERSSSDEAWRHLFNYAIQHKDLETARLAAKRALEITGEMAVYHARMEQIKA